LKRESRSFVIAGLDPAIHAVGGQGHCPKSLLLRLNMDARVKPGHDERQAPDQAKELADKES
jgi:hypothetical protein